MEQTEMEKMQVLVVTGMSGSGKSVVMDMMEDIGFYCIDNLPPQLIDRFVQICRESENHLRRLAIAVDLRSGDMFADAYAKLTELKAQPELQVKIICIEAGDEVIIKRYKETRRKHPLADQFHGSLHDAIAFERERLLPLKDIADYFIETSYFTATQLKVQIRGMFLDNTTDAMSVKVTSFGFKYGVSTESDLVFDVRCLPNPFYIPELRHHTGQEACVQDYVMYFPQSRELLQKIEDLVSFLIPLYSAEGKSSLVIAFGCTGGRHRSIVFAEKVGDYLISKGVRVIKQHRDVGKS